MFYCVSACMRVRLRGESESECAMHAYQLLQYHDSFFQNTGFFIELSGEITELLVDYPKLRGLHCQLWIFLLCAMLCKVLWERQQKKKCEACMVQCAICDAITAIVWSYICGCTTCHSCVERRGLGKGRCGWPTSGGTRDHMFPLLYLFQLLLCCF